MKSLTTREATQRAAQSANYHPPPHRHSVSPLRPPQPLLRPAPGLRRPGPPRVPRHPLPRPRPAAPRPQAPPAAAGRPRDSPGVCYNVLPGWRHTKTKGRLRNQYRVARGGGFGLLLFVKHRAGTEKSEIRENRQKQKQANQKACYDISISHFGFAKVWVKCLHQRNKSQMDRFGPSFSVPRRLSQRCSWKI